MAPPQKAKAIKSEADLYDEAALAAYTGLMSRMNINGVAAAKQAFDMADSFMAERQQRRRTIETKEHV